MNLIPESKLESESPFKWGLIKGPLHGMTIGGQTTTKNYISPKFEKLPHGQTWGLNAMINGRSYGKHIMNSQHIMICIDFASV